jgi:hypothetical protein
VRSTRHGVLVVSGCTLDPLACRLRPTGPMLVVQPCYTQRRPTGPAIRVGALRTHDDIAAMQDWIRTARFDPAPLPPHLIAVRQRTRAATSNEH